MNIAVRNAQQSPVDYTHCFHDHRLEVRGNDIAAEMLQKETVILYTVDILTFLKD